MRVTSMNNYRYLKALEEQMDLAQFYAKEGIARFGLYGADKGIGTQPGIRGNHKVTNTATDVVAKSADLNRWIQKRVVPNLMHSETYYVSPEIADALYEALPTFGEYKFHEEDAPTPYGFVYIDSDKWCRHTTPGGFDQNIHAISWMKMPVDFGKGDGEEEAYIIIGYGTSVNPKERHAEDNLLQMTNLAWWSPGEIINQKVSEILNDIFDGATVSHSYMGKDGIEVVEVETNLYRHFKQQAVEKLLEAVASIWAFMAQKITSLEKYHAPRNVRRRLPTGWEPDPVIQVVHLRGYKSNAEPNPLNGPHSGFSVRWAVRGFWRNQWFPSEQRHHKIWINPYVKGPVDAPFKNATKLFSVDR